MNLRLKHPLDEQFHSQWEQQFFNFFFSVRKISKLHWTAEGCANEKLENNQFGQTWKEICVFGKSEEEPRTQQGKWIWMTQKKLKLCSRNFPIRVFKKSEQKCEYLKIFPILKTVLKWPTGFTLPSSANSHQVREISGVIHCSWWTGEPVIYIWTIIWPP